MKLSIFYTNKCNINCNHCFLGLQKEYYQMSSCMLKDILTQCKCAGFNRVAFTGGEPLIYWKDIEKVLTEVNLQDVNISFSTNAYWAKDLKTSDQICKQLKARGVTQIEASCDEYHIKYIPLRNLINLACSAEKAGIKCKIVMCVSNKINYISLYAKLRKYVLKENIILQNVGTFGNAKENNIKSDLKKEVFMSAKCAQVMNPCITYTGDVYACCGPCILAGKNNVMYISNFMKEDLASIVNNMKNNEIINKVSQCGPYFLRRDEKEYYSSLCEFCLHYS